MYHYGEKMQVVEKFRDIPGFCVIWDGYFYRIAKVVNKYGGRIIWEETFGSKEQAVEYFKEWVERQHTMRR